MQIKDWDYELKNLTREIHLVEKSLNRMYRDRSKDILSNRAMLYFYDEVLKKWLTKITSIISNSYQPKTESEKAYRHWLLPLCEKTQEYFVKANEQYALRFWLKIWIYKISHVLRDTPENFVSDFEIGAITQVTQELLKEEQILKKQKEEILAKEKIMQKECEIALIAVQLKEASQSFQLPVSQKSKNELIWIHPTLHELGEIFNYY